VASSTATAVAKAAKKDPVQTKCREVSAALKLSTSMPPAACGMLGDILPFSLGICKEERHPFQQGAVDAVGKEMAGLEEALSLAVTDAQGRVEQLGRDRKAQEACVSELEAQLEGHRRGAHERKHALADAAIAFRRSKEALAEAEAKQKAGDKDIEEAMSKRKELAAVVAQVLEPLKAGTMEKEAVPEAAIGLVPRLLQFFHVEESLRPAIPAVLSKEPATRGYFDTMATAQLEKQIRDALEEFEAVEKAGAAARAARASVVASAKESLQAARERQGSEATAFTAAQGQEEASYAALQAAKQALKAFNPERARRGKAVVRAQDVLQSFREGPLAAFGELCNHTAAEPAPTAEAPGVTEEEVAVVVGPADAEALDAATSTA